MDIINVQKRDLTVKAKHLRKMGIVPCSVYGGGLPESVAIQMTQQDANNLFLNHRDGSKAYLRLEGKVIPTQIKEETRNFNNHNIEHIGFQALKADQPVNSVAHVLLKNTENLPGVLEHMTYEVPYSSLPEFMVDTVTLDMDMRQIGTIITIADIPELMDEHLTLQVEPDQIVVRIRDLNRGGDEEEAAE